MNMKELRESLGLSRKDVNEILGIPMRTIQNWEYEVNAPAPWLYEMLVREYSRIAKEKSEK